MSCNRPVPAWYSNSLTESGKRSLTFNPRYRYLGSDINYIGDLDIPCGKCLGCKADQSLVWSIRSYHESSCHTQNSFITLTYDQEHMPKDGKISKRDLQLFFKRLRKSLENSSMGISRIRYVACGEYGGQTRRPHYHAIIFGVDWLEGAIPIKEDLYTNESLVSVWGKGLVSIAPVNMASICYVCGYVSKKIDDPDTFMLMSRRPGIGHNWLDKYADDLSRTGVVSIEGRSYQVPKRYFQWSEEMLSGVLADRKKFAREQSRKVSYSERFAQGNAREKNLRAKAVAKKLLEKI